MYVYPVTASLGIMDVCLSSYSLTRDHGCMSIQLQPH